MRTSSRVLAATLILLTACGAGEVQQVSKPSPAPAVAPKSAGGTWQSTGDEDVVIVARQGAPVTEFLLASCKEREQSLTESERQQCAALAKSASAK